MRYAILLLIVPVLAGCGLTKKLTDKRDEGQLEIVREVRIIATGEMIVVEVLDSGDLTRDKGGKGDHQELKLDPSKLKK